MIDIDKSEDRLEEWGEPEPWSARAGRRDAKEKLTAGLRGLKYAMRGDSSFFAHAYRGLLIALAAAMLGVGPFGWLLLVMAAALVLIAELMHSAVERWPGRSATPKPPARRSPARSPRRES